MAGHESRENQEIPDDIHFSLLGHEEKQGDSLHRPETEVFSEKQGRVRELWMVI